jgi:hypothetical protein
MGERPDRMDEATTQFVKAVEELVDLGLTRDDLNDMLVDLVEVEDLVEEDA